MLRPIRDTVPPSRPPTPDERDAAMEESIRLINRNATLSAEIAERNIEIASNLKAYNIAIAIVHTRDIEGVR